MSLPPNSANPEVRSQPTDNESPSERPPLTCPVCWESLALSQPNVYAPCGHVLCKFCASVVLGIKPECPECKAYVSLDSVNPIYF